MTITSADSQVLKRLDFPAYCIRLLDNGLVAIAGGGGTSKTGVTNWIEIGHINYTNTDDPNEPFHTEFKLVATLETTDAIMKFVCFSSQSGDLYLAAAVNNVIEVYKIQPKVHQQSPNDINHQNGTTNNQLKQRKTSQSSSKTQQNGTTRSQTELEASAELKLVNQISLRQEKEKRHSQSEANHNHHHHNQEESIVSLQVHRGVDNVVVLCAGTSTGSILLWSLEFEANNNLTNKINVVRLHEFKNAHGTSEIDDLQVNNDGQLLSIGKDNKTSIWSLRSLKKITDLDYTRSLKDTNLRMKHARFSLDSSYLYTTYIPRIRGGTKSLCSFIQKWRHVPTSASQPGAFNYRIEQTYRLNSTIITSIQASKDGHFVSVGDCDGKIYLFDSHFNRIKNFKKQHSSVITDLLFYHDCELNPKTSKPISNGKQQQTKSTADKKQPLNFAVYDLNKLILSISIDRTIQLYKFINTNNRLVSDLLAPKSANPLISCCLSMKLFQLAFLLLVFFLLFCYFFTYIE